MSVVPAPGAELTTSRPPPRDARSSAAARPRCPSAAPGAPVLGVEAAPVVAHLDRHAAVLARCAVIATTRGSAWRTMLATASCTMRNASVRCVSESRSAAARSSSTRAPAPLDALDQRPHGRGEPQLLERHRVQVGDRPPQRAHRLAGGRGGAVDVGHARRASRRAGRRRARRASGPRRRAPAPARRGCPRPHAAARSPGPGRSTPRASAAAASSRRRPDSSRPLASATEAWSASAAAGGRGRPSVNAAPRRAGDREDGGEPRRPPRSRRSGATTACSRPPRRAPARPTMRARSSEPGPSGPAGPRAPPREPAGPVVHQQDARVGLQQGAGLRRRRSGARRPRPRPTPRGAPRA